MIALVGGTGTVSTVALRRSSLKPNVIGVRIWRLWIWTKPVTQSARIRNFNSECLGATETGRTKDCDGWNRRFEPAYIFDISGCVSAILSCWAAAGFTALISLSANMVVMGTIVSGVWLSLRLLLLSYVAIDRYCLYSIINYIQHSACVTLKNVDMTKTVILAAGGLCGRVRINISVNDFGTFVSIWVHRAT